MSKMHTPQTEEKDNFRRQVYNFVKKETLAQVFSCEFCKIFRNAFLTECLRRLLLVFFLLLTFFVLANQYKDLSKILYSLNE